MRHSYIDAALSFTDVTINEGVFLENSYNPNTNEINLNTCNDTWMGRVAKLALGRPLADGFSLAHELGHAVFEKLSLNKDKEFIKVFGRAGSYKGGTLPMLLSRFAPETEESLTRYGDVDTEEDFADCFAYLCTAKAMNIAKFKLPIREKLKFTKRILDDLKKQYR